MIPADWDQSGFCLLRLLADASTVSNLIQALDTNRGEGESGSGRAGRRHVLRAIPEVGVWLDSPAVRSVTTAVLGPGARPVRGLLFDKNSAHNWRIGWHQDGTITVAERVDLPGFAGWTCRDGVWHVRPPAQILEGVLTLRLHLDPCGSDNGPLKVLPGTHRNGRLNPAEIDAWVQRRTAVVCPAAAGDVLAMRPLLLHASDPARRPERRRVLHVEFASIELPPPLRWCPD